MKKRDGQKAKKKKREMREGGRKEVVERSGPRPEEGKSLACAAINELAALSTYRLNGTISQGPIPLSSRVSPLVAAVRRPPFEARVGARRRTGDGMVD